MEKKEFKAMHDFTGLNDAINETVPVSVMSSYVLLAKAQLLNIVCKFDEVDNDTMHNIANVNATLSLMDKWVNSIECVDGCLDENSPEYINELIADIESMTKETLSRLRSKLANITE